MKKAKTMMLLAARWLVVFMTSLVVLSATAFDSAPNPPGKPCTESCAVRCPCCISKGAPSHSPAPLAPSSPRVSIDKSFQLIPLIASVITLAGDYDSAPTFSTFLLSARGDAPLYQRHCAYLI
jgi:hypothetical protein